MIIEELSDNYACEALLKQPKLSNLQWELECSVFCLTQTNLIYDSERNNSLNIAELSSKSP